ncbi:MAG: hypothetical protein COB98_07475 [Flavobacteriaceae bacterium]|nr:MAG: hypothetical protein COB98_07475 [Flavobacteriaceae bacterium]
MKKQFFKLLVDIIFGIHVLGLAGIIFAIPVGIVNINQIKVSPDDWTLVHVIYAIISIVVYVLFLIGLFYLRKTALFLLKRNQFSLGIILNLKSSGLFFIVAGGLSFVQMLGLWLWELYQGTFYLTYESNTMTPLFITIIGLFFVLQSNSLNFAMKFKNENELTI